MKILIALADSTGKNIAFITDDLVTRTLEEIISLVQKKVIEGVHVVSTEHGPYVRANRNETKTDNLDFLSVPAADFLEELKQEGHSQAAERFRQLLEKRLREQADPSKIIYLDDRARGTRNQIFNRLKPLAPDILAAAKEYNIDPSTLAAILIDEYPRSGPDDLLDILGKYSLRDTSIGLAQIKKSTARGIVSDGYYEDVSDDISDSDLYDLLAEDKTSIRFAAAFLKREIDLWKPYIDLSDRPEILGTLYSLPKVAPHGKPKQNDRGKQIKGKLYPLATEALDD